MNNLFLGHCSIVTCRPTANQNGRIECIIRQFPPRSGGILSVGMEIVRRGEQSVIMFTDSRVSGIEVFSSLSNAS